MKKRIFSGILLATIFSIILAALLTVAVIYSNSSKDVKIQVLHEANYVAKAIELLDENETLLATYLKSVGKETKNRLTLINPDGTVSYDSDISLGDLDNHKNRPEIEAAMKNGFGEEKRHSATIGEENYYYAVRLSNDTVLRIACITKTFFGIVKDVALWTILSIVLVVFLSALLAKKITRSIIKPLKNLDLEKPLSNETYDELSPLLMQMEKQKNKILKQVDLLLEKNKEIEYITNKTSEAIVILKENGNVLSFNLAAKKLFDESEFDTYLSICRDIDYISAVESALKGKSQKIKLFMGDKIYSMSATSIEKSDNSFAVFLFIRDITEFDNAQKMRREFSANVSHELKTPLTSIMGCAEIIENGIAKPQDIPHFAQQINSQASRLLILIEDIIKISSLDENTVVRQFEDVDISLLIKDVIKELGTKAKNKNVSFDFNGEIAIINGCKPILREMLFNLCDNAINYNKPNGKIIVSVSKDQNELGLSNKIILSVKDNGIGIDESQQERVFERFYRVDKSHSKETGGTGLGLSIVKHGATLHNAQLSLKSKIDEGTEITITF